MSYDNLPYIVEVRIIYGSDHRRKIQFIPWKNIVNEIDERGNINLFSKELMKLIPSCENGEDCEIYAAKLIKKPAARSEYIRSLLKEFECFTYQEYRKKTKTPPKKTDKVFNFDSGNINLDIDNIMMKTFSTKQFKTKKFTNIKKIEVPISAKTYANKKASSSRIVSFTQSIDTNDL